MNLCDIINRLQEGKAIPKIMQDISKYDINDVVLSQKSRAWMHCAVSDTLPLPFMFEIDPNVCDTTTDDYADD